MDYVSFFKNQLKQGKSFTQENFDEFLFIAESLWSINRTQLLAGLYIPSAQQIDALQAAFARRKLGEPLAYILGHSQFYANTYRITPAVLAPRNDSECLVSHILKKKRPYLRLLDIGTGSGVFAISIACCRPDWHITATDIDKKALQLARYNAKQLNAQITFYKSDLFGAIAPRRQYDIILSNPPYVSAQEYFSYPSLRYEPRCALLSDANGLGHIYSLLNQGAFYLRRGGALIIEHGWKQGTAVKQLALSAGYVRLNPIYDLAGRRRALEMHTS